MAIEEGAFAERGIELHWEDIPEGTGKMCQLLQDGETDLAIILTEGIVKSITEGNPARIIQEYIATPLLWGIHVGAQSRHRKLDDLEHSKAAVSRFGSGSHLMAYVHASSKGWNTKELTFEVIHNLEGAKTALTHGAADYFMWEHFTTKPLVDSGVFRRLGDCPTPWPCFLLVGTERFLAKEAGTLGHIVAIINRYTKEFKAIPSIDRTLANRYGLQLPDVREWLSLTEWSQSQIGLGTLQKVQQTLLDLGLITLHVPAKTLLGP